MKLAVLCGGVGGSKLVLGLHHEFPEHEITAIVNTGDDLEFLGLHISPDLDTVTYTVAGIVNESTGWGLRDDTFEALAMFDRYDHETWFRLGDRDLATHLVRTALLRSGQTLTEATVHISQRLGVTRTILPMTDADVRTRVKVAHGWLDFQEYFVKRRHEDMPLDVEHAGVASARPTSGVRDALTSADLIIAAPSNPVVSIGPILAVPGLLDCVKQSSARKVAVSPFVGRQSITGPADALMAAIGREPTSLGLAGLYHDWLDTIVIDESDREQTAEVESRGTRVAVTETVMPDLAAKRRLARFVVEAGG